MEFINRHNEQNTGNAASCIVRFSVTGLAVIQVVLKSRWVFIMLGTLLVTACNSEQQLPSDASLTITPSSRSINVVQQEDEQNRCLYSADNYQDVPLVFYLANGQGSPIGEADLSIYVDFTGNTFSGVSVLQLFEDKNGNGVVDEESELVSGADNDIFKTKTTRYSGDHQMLLRINLSCAFKGEVFAFSGASTAMASIEVTARSTVIVPSGMPL